MARHQVYVITANCHQSQRLKAKETRGIGCDSCSVWMLSDAAVKDGVTEETQMTDGTRGVINTLGSL